MAASYSDFGKIAADAGFQQRVDYAMVNSALAICSELASVASHQQRVTFARQVLGGGYNVTRAAMAVLEDTTVAGEATLATGSPGYGVTDPHILTATTSIWNALAGA